LTFGARGSNIKPYSQAGQDPPPVPEKAERREKMKNDERRVYNEEDKNERRRNAELNGIGLGVFGHGVRERGGKV
jgi:hypothetical protein